MPVSQTSASPSPLISRNAHCPCGSLRRYKNCCDERAIFNALLKADTPKYAALDAQLAGDYTRAERLYRETLQLTPHDIDALHMLALTQHQQGCLCEALVGYHALLDRPGELSEAVWHNLGLTFAAAAYTVDSPRAQLRRSAYSDSRQSFRTNGCRVGQRILGNAVGRRGAGRGAAGGAIGVA